MPQTLTPRSEPLTAPRFYITPTQRLGLRSLLPAFVLALTCLLAVRYALIHAHHGKYLGNSGSDAQEDDDDPSQIDTIYLGGPNQAPTAARPHSRANTVHPYVVVRLPRSGEATGQIPNTPAGHLLYAWLAAFNDKDPRAAAQALPVQPFPDAEEAQVELRRRTGGFTLLSAREIAPGLLVFRIQDQTSAAAEALGTLQTDPAAIPATIASFSLRSIP